MVPASGRPKLSFAMGVAAYAVGIALLVVIGAHVASLAVAVLLRG